MARKSDSAGTAADARIQGGPACEVLRKANCLPKIAPSQAGTPRPEKIKALQDTPSLRRSPHSHQHRAS